MIDIVKRSESANDHSSNAQQMNITGFMNARKEHKKGNKQKKR